MSIVFTAQEIRLGTLASSMLGKGKSTDSDAREGFRVLASAFEQGADYIVMRELFGMAKNNVTLAKVVVTLTGLVPADADDTGFSAIVTQVNYLSALSMQPVATAKHVAAKHPKVGSFEALRLILADITGEGAVGKAGKGKSEPKSEAERFADLLKAVNKFARDFEVNPFDVVNDLADGLERDKAQEADEAADEAAMAA